jgi:hypothetical protein
MGRRNRGKENKKPSSSLSIADRLKEARHEFQTIPQHFPIARQLLLDEIKRLEVEILDNNDSTSPKNVKAQDANAKASEEVQVNAARKPSDEPKIAAKDEKDVEEVSQGSETHTKTDTTDVADLKSLQEQPSAANSLSQSDETESETYPSCPKDTFSGSEVTTIACQEIPEFSPRSFEGEKSSLKIFIPHQEYPGVSIASSSLCTLLFSLHHVSPCPIAALTRDPPLGSTTSSAASSAPAASP